LGIIPLLSAIAGPFLSSNFSKIHFGQFVYWFQLVRATLFFGSILVAHVFFILNLIYRAEKRNTGDESFLQPLLEENS
jgi:integral membrane sensor domain MASE1